MELLKEETLAKKLLTKGSLLYLFTFLIAPTGYIIRIIISNNLSVQEIWIIYSLIWLASILTIFHDLWLTDSLSYFLPQYYIKKENNKIKTVLRINFILQVSLSLLIWAWFFFYSNYIANNYFHFPQTEVLIKYFSLYFILNNFLRFFSWIYLSFQDTFSNRILEFLRMWWTLWLTFYFFITNNWTLLNYWLAWIWWLILTFIISLSLFKKYYHLFTTWKIEYSKSLLKEYFTYSFWILISSQVLNIIVQIDQQIILYFRWAEQAGYYTNFSSLINMIRLIISPILILVFPISTELITKKDYNKLWIFQNILYKYFSLFSISLWFLCGILWNIIATILFWTKFIYSGEIFQYWAPFMIFFVLTQINLYILSWRGEIKKRFKVLLNASLINIIASFFFIFTYGTIWWVFSMCTWWVALFYFSNKEINKKLKIKFDYKFFIQNLLLITILSTIIYLIKDKIFIINDSHKFINLIYLLIIWTIYSIIILWLNYKELIKLKHSIKNIRK